MHTPSPDAHGIAVLFLILAALYLFTRERFPLESSSLIVLIVLSAGFYFFPYAVNDVPLGPSQFFAGFGNEALIAVCALLIIGKGLEMTGALKQFVCVPAMSCLCRVAMRLRRVMTGAAT